MIHTKCQDLFSLKNKTNRMLSATIYLVTLSVTTNPGVLIINIKKGNNISKSYNDICIPYVENISALGQKYVTCHVKLGLWA